MNIEDFTKEELINLIVRYLRGGTYFNYANEYADDIESGDWLNKETWECIEDNERLRNES